MTGPLANVTNVSFDGYSVCFDMAWGGEQVSCAISLAALDTIADDRRRQRTQVLLNFKTHQERIAHIAQTLFERRPESVDGVIRIWENDVEDDAEGTLG